MDQVVDKNPRANRDEGGMMTTPLHEAAISGHLDICSLILDQVEEKNPKDIYGETPLHYAAINGHLDICHLIFYMVDDRNPKDDDGKTPWDLAASKGHSDITKIFRLLNQKTCSFV